ncbi:glycosyltransferase family 4 protein [Perlabentimonas gracilis]|jgi:glycosyltransferase involved in cell wall biosynthesis|uniref:glycosyltransferase family 4 protein n=1 Tax=Perlabentimonas gracilis TaxID=2715279 RepID=UPI00140A9620|nr:glycosyltransferase family 4 protein [Perlabentimonas gracilis]NHB68930.1 glycosyltransferase family 4 protein [Perlabentimonas gracilis]
MRIGTILPHTKLYGGVRRFLELGNLFEKAGHTPIIYTPEGLAPTWFDYRGEVKTFESLGDETLDALFFTEPEYLQLALTAKAKRKIFYFIHPKERLTIFRKHPSIEIFANSTNLLELAQKKYKVKAFPAFGGINLSTHNPKPHFERNSSEPFVVMAYGRLARKVKGTKYVINACKRLVKKGYNIELLLFDTPVSEKMKKKNGNLKLNIPFKFIQNHPVEKNQDLYHKAHVFVSAECSAGWSNTAAEAMACGTPVIGTIAGTKNFLLDNQTGIIITQSSRKIAAAIELLIKDEPFRQALAKNGRMKIEVFDWSCLAETIINRIAEPIDSND